MASSKININKFKLNVAEFPSLKIDKISPGKTVIRELQLQDAKLETNNASLTLQGITVDLKITLSLDYKFTLPVPYNGTAFAIGELQIPLNFGDININIPNTILSIPQADLKDVKADVAPIEGLVLPSLVANSLRLDNLKVPESGFRLSHGLTLENMELKKLSMPAATADAMTVRSVRGMNVTVPAIELPEISLEFGATSTDLQQVQTKVIGAQQCTDWKTVVDIPLVLKFDARVCTQPEITLTINKLTIKNTNLSLKLGKTVARNLELPFNILGIQLANVKLTGIEIPQIKVM